MSSQRPSLLDRLTGRGTSGINSSPLRSNRNTPPRFDLRESRKLGDRRRFGQQPTRLFTRQQKQGSHGNSRTPSNYPTLHSSPVARSRRNLSSGFSSLPKASLNDVLWESYQPLSNPLGRASEPTEQTDDSDSITIVGFPPHHYKTVLDKFNKYGDIKEAFLFKNVLQIIYRNPMRRGVPNEFVQRALLEDMKWIRPKYNDDPFVLGVVATDKISMDISITGDEMKRVAGSDAVAAAAVARRPRARIWKDALVKWVRRRLPSLPTSLTLEDILQYCLYLLKS